MGFPTLAESLWLSLLLSDSDITDPLFTSGHACQYSELPDEEKVLDAARLDKFSGLRAKHHIEQITFSQFLGALDSRTKKDDEYGPQ